MHKHFVQFLISHIAGCVEGIHRVLVLGLVLIAGTAIEQAPSVGPRRASSESCHG